MLCVQAAVLCDKLQVHRHLLPFRKILKYEQNIMVQWMNLHQNKIFINWTRLPLLCEKSRPILLVLEGLTAGQQSDEILIDLENVKILY